MLFVLLTRRLRAFWIHRISRLALLLVASLSCSGQTVQGVITGHVIDSATGVPIESAQITVANLLINLRVGVESTSSGIYIASSLPPGSYRVRVSAAKYQPQELYELQLPVSGNIDLNFQLRPLNDVWERERYRSILLPDSESELTFFGPDVDSSHSESVSNNRANTSALEASLSQVVDPIAIRDLPLSGRDVYTLLVTQPAVTSDTTTARGLGLTANGQRPTSSYFLLDGFENNNYLLTGPQTIVAPEAVQEYRISTGSFSAEYGGTAGYLANAVTRAGGDQWHGLVYLYVMNDTLDANDFQNNARGLIRPPLKEYEGGYQAGGYLRKNSLYFSSALDALVSHGTGDPINLTLPTSIFVSDFTVPGGIAQSLLKQYPSGVRQSNTYLTVSSVFQPPVTIDHSLALERLDHVVGDGAHRQMLRVAYANLDRPDFIWSPYKEFTSGLGENTFNLGLSSTDVLSPTVALETKVGLDSDNLGWNRAHPEIPTLTSDDGTVLPGSPAFYAFKNRNIDASILEDGTWVWGRHLLKAGVGILFRRLSGYLNAGAGGQYTFENVRHFGLDDPTYFSVSVDRQALPQLQIPQFDRQYHEAQFDFFLQDTFRWKPRFAINYGVRYENFGSPVNTGAQKDGTVVLGGGVDFGQRIADATIELPVSGSQSLYRKDDKDWAGRFGFSYSLRRDAKLVLHGAFGIFYDRPFDNLWETAANNNFVLANFNAAPGNYLAPISQILPAYSSQPVMSNFPYLTMIRPNLKTPYVESSFVGVEQRFGSHWTLDVNGLGTLGRRLITTDEVNRPYGVYNPNLPLIEYRANQGNSSYFALTPVLEGKVSRGQIHVAYSWSHSIDNQSDPLAGDFFDLNYAGINPSQPARGVAAFTREFQSGSDRGNSDFDQRQNLVLYSVWDLPASSGPKWLTTLSRNWKISQLAAFRSGEPYTVFAGPSLIFVNNRANLVSPSATADQNVLGGKLLLNAASFQMPEAGQLGNLGRNALYGPGLYSVDGSLSRSIPLSVLGENGRLVLRADVFNLLNHANLNNPESVLGSQTFGVALYGRLGYSAGFPSLQPLNETGRQVQLMLRIEF